MSPINFNNGRNYDNKLRHTKEEIEARKRQLNKDEIPVDSDSAKKVAPEGTTAKREVDDIKNIIAELPNNSVAHVQEASDNSSRVRDNAADSTQNNPDNEVWDNTISIIDFVNETLENAGIEADDESIAEIYISILQTSLEGNFIGLRIGDLADLLDFAQTSNIQSGTVELLTELINKLLTNGINADTTQATVGEVKDFILDYIAKHNIPQANETTPVETSDDDKIFEEQKISDFVRKTLSENGIEPTDELVNRITIEIIKASMEGNLIKPNISMMSELIDIGLSSSSGVNIVELYQDFFRILLNNSYNTSATYGEVKAFIMEIVNSIQSEPEPEPVDPLEELFNKYKFQSKEFVVAYIDEIKGEFCLTDKNDGAGFYTIIKNQLLAKVAELGAENIDFEAAKQIIYDTMHGIWPLKTEVAEVIKQTPNGKDLSEEEVMGIVNSVSRDIYVACYTIYFHQTGDKKALTPEEKLGAINNVLQTKRPDLYEVEQPEPDTTDPLEAIYNQYGFTAYPYNFIKAYIQSQISTFCIINSDYAGESITQQHISRIMKAYQDKKNENGGSIDFETAKQIIYEQLYSVYPLLTEVAEAIAQTPSGKNMSEQAVNALIESLRYEIYNNCSVKIREKVQNTGNSLATLTQEEKLEIINNVLRTKNPELFEEPQQVDPLEEKYNTSGFSSGFMTECIQSFFTLFCFPGNNSYAAAQAVCDFLISQFNQAYTDAAQPVSFEAAKQIIYEQLHNIFPLKSEVADVIIGTPGGQNLSEEEINTIIDSIRTPLHIAFRAKRNEINSLTGKFMIVLTPEQKAEIINDVLRANCPQLYEEPQVNYDAQLQAIFQKYGISIGTGQFPKACILSVSEDFCFPALIDGTVSNILDKLLDNPSSIANYVLLRKIYLNISSQIVMAIQARGLTTGTVDFETAKEIIYDELSKAYIKVSEFVDIVKKTPQGANMSDEEIIAMLNEKVTYYDENGELQQIFLSNKITRACDDKRSEMAPYTNNWPVLTDAIKEEIVMNLLNTFKPELFEESPVASTSAEAMQILLDKMSSAYVGNLSVESFLLQFKAEAAQYMRLNFNLEQSFADVLAMYFANAISENFSPVSGLAKDADLDLIKEKLITFVQDMSFLNRTQKIGNKTYSGLISYSPDVAGPITNDYMQTSGSGFKLHGNSKGGYNENGDPNSKTFYDFITNYFENIVYGGNLNEVQMQFLYQKVMLKFGNSWSYASLTSAGFDKNSNGMVLDELFAAMMAVAEEYPNLSNSGIETIDLDTLFGSSSYLTADVLRIKDTKITLPGGKTDYALHLSNNKYISNSDAGVSMLMSELINTAKKWRITTDDADNTYQIDFINAFIKLLSEECGLTVQYDTNGNPKLTRELLEKYLSNHTPDELKALINSDIMRTAYYDEIYNKSDGVVSGEFTQGPNGDCWFCSIVKALTSSPAGQEILANAVTRNADGSYTIRFKGTGTYSTIRHQGDYEYTITKEEIYEVLRSGNHLYSNNFANFALEIALSRHIKETIYDPNEGNSWYNEAMEANTAYGGDPYLGNSNTSWPSWQTVDVLHLFTGELYNNYQVNSWSFSRSNPNKFKEFILERLGMEPGTEGAITSGTCGNYVIQVNIAASTDVSGIITLHACSLTKVSEDYVWFVNPYTNVEEKMKWEDFLTKLDAVYCILLPEQT